MGRKRKLISEETVKAVTEDAAAQNAASVQTGKAGMIAQAVQTLAMMDKDSLEKFMASMAASHAAAIPDDAAAKNAASIAMKGAVKEELEEIFGGENLAEEFKEKIETLFEAAVNSRVSLVLTEAEERFEQALSEQSQAVVESLVEKIDSYLSYVVEEWMEENEVAIESSIRTEIAEQFMEGLKELFQEHYIDIPDDKVDIVEGYAEKVAELEAKLSEEINARLSLEEQLSLATMEDVFEESASDLSKIQREKFRVLAEGIEFDGDVEKYEKKLNIIKEKHFKSASINPLRKDSLLLSEDVEEDEENPRVVSNPEMRPYADAISRLVKKH